MLSQLKDVCKYVLWRFFIPVCARVFLSTLLLESVVNIPRNYGEKDRHVSCQKDRLFQGSHSLMLKK